MKLQLQSGRAMRLSNRRAQLQQIPLRQQVHRAGSSRVAASALPPSRAGAAPRCGACLPRLQLQAAAAAAQASACNCSEHITLSRIINSHEHLFKRSHPPHVQQEVADRPSA